MNISVLYFTQRGFLILCTLFFERALIKRRRNSRCYLRINNLKSKQMVLPSIESGSLGTNMKGKSESLRGDKLMDTEIIAVERLMGQQLLKEVCALFLMKSVSFLAWKIKISCHIHSLHMAHGFHIFKICTQNSHGNYSDRRRYKWSLALS